MDVILRQIKQCEAKHAICENSTWEFLINVTLDLQRIQRHVEALQSTSGGGTINSVSKEQLEDD